MLLGGDPGVGKSTLAEQIAISTALSGERVLIIATEQTRAAILRRIHRLAASVCSSPSTLPIDVIDDIGDLVLLPQLLVRQILSRNGKYSGTGLVIVDSLHGLGNGPSDKRFYSAIYEFLRTASAAQVTTVSLAHMNKTREISGPRALEHAIDVSVCMRHGVSCRALVVPKNRSGPSTSDPYCVTIDDVTTRLIPSALAISSSARVRTISSDGPTVIEVNLSIPRHERGFLKSPGLSIQEIAIVVDLMVRIHTPAKPLPNLGVTVRAPGGTRYRREHSLPIAMAIASALARTEIPERFVVMGDVDLRGNICELSQSAMQLVEDARCAGVITGRDIVIASLPNEANGVDASTWVSRNCLTVTSAIEEVNKVDVSRGH